MAVSAAWGWVSAKPASGGADGLQQWWPLLQGLVVAAIILRILGFFSSKSKGADALGDAEEEDTFFDCRESEQDAVLENLSLRPSIHGTFAPSTGMLRANPEEPYAFDNENASGFFLPLHRPTFDKALEKSGNYPYAYHFRGRKRLWENRFQMKFKHALKDPLYFGLQLDTYVPLSGSQARAAKIATTAVRKAVGSQLYHSVGDDPKKVKGPHELPVITFPLWAFDQFIQTPEGEDPPSLTDPHFHELGVRRTTDRGAFIREISALELHPGPTYTFSFWGPSQFGDVIMWDVKGVIPGWNLDFNGFCGAPPVHIVFYTLRPSFPREDGTEDTRHLEAQKDYLFKLALWSSRKPPPPERLAELLQHPGSSTTFDPKPPKAKEVGMLRGAMMCCAGQRH